VRIRRDVVFSDKDDVRGGGFANLLGSRDVSKIEGSFES
jgi:hypothetical protein